MRTREVMRFYNGIIIAGMAGAILLTGCASNPAKESYAPDPKAPPLPPGVAMHKDKDIQGVWLADGFNFTGYDALYISEIDFKGVERSNEGQMREMAKGELQAKLVEALSATKLFPKVTVRADEIPAGSKSLKLNSTIIEYEKGGGGARYFAGVYGAGQPVIKVRGQMYDGDKLVFLYEARRSGESGGARMFGGFMSDEDVQRNDIKDLAFDLADFVKRSAGAK
jgi:hypothetical protein